MDRFHDFEDLDGWVSFWHENGASLGGSNPDLVGARIKATGFVEPLTQACATPEEIGLRQSWRDGLIFDGVGSRARAVMLVYEQLIREQGLDSPRIYLAEAVTPFAMRLRGMFPRVIGSEFTLDAERRDWLYPIPVGDVTELFLPDGLFDFVSTNEVLEHVPDLDMALGELSRVLRPGGWHVGTVPFNYFATPSQRRARLENGRIIHLMEPEYHGDALTSDGVLVFENPGWDIIERARAAGFSRAFMRYIVSEQYGIISEHIGGTFVFCAQK